MQSISFDFNSAVVKVAAHHFPQAEADILDLAKSVLPLLVICVCLGTDSSKRSDPPFIKSNIQFQGALSKRGEVNVAYKSRYFILTHNFFLFYYKSVNVSYLILNNVIISFLFIRTRFHRA